MKLNLNVKQLFSKRSEKALSENTANISGASKAPSEPARKTNAKGLKAVAGEKKGILVIGKTKWAINISWRVISASGKGATDIRNWITETANNNKFDYVVLTNIGNTAGFASSYLGHAKGMPSLAAAMAAAKPGNWVAVVETSAGYYITANRNGSVDPLGDKILPLKSSPAVIRDQIQKIYATFDEKVETHVYAPKKFEFTTEEWPVPLDKLTKNNKLQHADPVKARKQQITKIALWTTIAGGSYYFWNVIEDMNRPPPPPKEVIVDAKPWANKESASQVGKACALGEAKIIPNMAGWSTKSFACINGTISAVYRRDEPINQLGTPFDWFANTAAFSGYPVAGAKLIKPGNATYSISVPMSQTVWTETTVPDDARRAGIMLVNRLDNIFVNSSMQDKKKKYYRTVTVTIKTNDRLDLIFDQMKDIKGLVLEKITKASGQPYTIVVSITNEEGIPKSGKIVFKRPAPLRKFDTNYLKVFKQ
jgi:Pilin accessory protein (PilO)